MCMCVCVYLPTLPYELDMTQGNSFKSVFNRFVFKVLSSARPIDIPGLKNPDWPTICTEAGERIVGFILFPRVLALCEMKTGSSWIWTRIGVSISNADKPLHHGNLHIYMCVCVCACVYVCMCVYYMCVHACPFKSCGIVNKNKFHY